MASPSTIERRKQEAAPQARVFVCIFCRKQKSLTRLRPHKWYACASCIAEQGGITDAIRTVIIREIWRKFT